MQMINPDGSAARVKPGIPCIESRLLADFLGKAESELIDYQSLSEVIGQNVQGKARGYLLTAREIILREKGMVFRPVRNLGLKRLIGKETAKLEDRPRHIYKTARKALREFQTVDLAKIDDPQTRAACVGKMTLMGLTIHTHSPKQMKRLQDSVGSQKQLDMKATLEFFKAEIGVE